MIEKYIYLTYLGGTFGLATSFDLWMSKEAHDVNLHMLSNFTMLIGKLTM
jgi:hypothetical protein